VAAACGVAAYLKAHSNPGKEVFALRNGDEGKATFELARRFVRESSSLCGIWRGPSKHWLT